MGGNFFDFSIPMQDMLKGTNAHPRINRNTSCPHHTWITSSLRTNWRYYASTLLTKNRGRLYPPPEDNFWNSPQRLFSNLGNNMLYLATVLAFSMHSNKQLIFIARQHTDERYWYGKSVCPSVCLSVRPLRSGIRWKRRNISSQFLHHTVVQSL